MKTVLIIGINGFLGSRLAQQLSNQYKIVGLTRRNTNNIKDKECKIYYRNSDTIETIFIENKIDIIIYVATVYGRKDEPLSSLIESNILLPIKAYELGLKYNASLFINTDSHFSLANEQPYLNNYTMSKQQALEWLKKNINKCKIVNMIIFHLYGPNDSPEKFVMTIINDIKNKQKIKLTPGKQVRDFIYIDDVVSAFETVIKSRNKLLPFSQFEVGSGYPVTIESFVKQLKLILNRGVELDFGGLPYREQEIMYSVSNNRPLVELGWKPVTALEKGLIKTIFASTTYE